MSTILLVVGALLLISTCGIHFVLMNKSKLEQPMIYTTYPLMSVIPWISGFVLPVVAWANITEIHWIALFFINLAAVAIIGPWLTRIFLVCFSSGKGLGKDMVIAFIAGIIALGVGLIIR